MSDRKRWKQFITWWNDTYYAGKRFPPNTTPYSIVNTIEDKIYDIKHGDKTMLNTISKYDFSAYKLPDLFKVRDAIMRLKDYNLEDTEMLAEVNRAIAKFLPPTDFTPKTRGLK